MLSLSCLFTEIYVFTVQGCLLLSAEMALGNRDGEESNQLRDGVLLCGSGRGQSGPVQSSPVGSVVEAGDCSNKLGVLDHPRCILCVAVSRSGSQPCKMY